jgi:hypothetical protein
MDGVIEALITPVALLVVDGAGNVVNTRAARPDGRLPEPMLVAHELTIAGGLVPRSARTDATQAEYGLATTVPDLLARRRYCLGSDIHQEIIVEYTPRSAPCPAIAFTLAMSFAFSGMGDVRLTPAEHPSHGFLITGAHRDSALVVTFSAPAALDFDRLIASYPLKLAPGARWRIAVTIAGSSPPLRFRFAPI